MRIKTYQHNGQTFEVDGWIHRTTKPAKDSLPYGDARIPTQTADDHTRFHRPGAVRDAERPPHLNVWAVLFCVWWGFVGLLLLLWATTPW